MFRKTVCFLYMIMLLFLAGCWDYNPISNLSVATGMGIDAAEDGRIELSLQILGSSSGSQGSQAGSAAPPSSSTTNVSAKGATVMEAVNNVVPILGEPPFLSHLQLILIGENAAKEGLDKIWDFLERDHETGRDLRVLVVKNGTAKAVLEAKADIDQIGAVEVANDSENKHFGKNIKTLGFKVTELLHQPLSGIVTGVIDPGNSTSLKEMKVEGGAVFHRGKLTGYLDGDESRGYLFAKDKLYGTVLTIENPKEAGKLVSIEVISSTGKLSAKLKDGKPALGIQITARGNIGEEQGGADLTGKDDIKALKKETESRIIDEIRAMLKKSQEELACDILNFNDILYKHDYKNFEKIKDNWETLYSQAEISIEVDFLIERPGAIKKPAFNK